MAERPFEELPAWQSARRFAVRVMRLTESWPEREPPGITAEIRRDVVDVPAKIASGSLALDPDDPIGAAELAARLPLARRLLREVVIRLDVAAGLGLLDEATLADLEREADEVRRAIDDLIDRLPTVPVEIDPFRPTFHDN